VTLADIRNPLLRRALVVATVAAMLACMLPLWLAEAIWRRVREEFGEDLAAAWRGPRQ